MCHITFCNFQPKHTFFLLLWVATPCGCVFSSTTPLTKANSIRQTRPAAHEAEKFKMRWIYREQCWNTRLIVQNCSTAIHCVIDGGCFFPHQLKPEMERYEWVVIRHPELASSVKDQENTASSEGQNSDNHSLQQPEKPVGELSPFLSARHFNLNSKNTSMFMAGNFDSIIVGEWIIVNIFFLVFGHVYCVSCKQ